MSAPEGCRWGCEDPVTPESAPLCPRCRAANDGPRHTCARYHWHGTSMGVSCYLCDAAERDRREAAERNAPIVAQLRAIRARFLAEEWREPWPGADFGKVIVGQSINRAIRELGGDA